PGDRMRGAKRGPIHDDRDRAGDSGGGAADAAGPIGCAGCPDSPADAGDGGGRGCDRASAVPAASDDAGAVDRWRGGRGCGGDLVAARAKLLWIVGGGFAGDDTITLHSLLPGGARRESRFVRV